MVFKPGQKVLCIKADTQYELGRVYTVINTRPSVFYSHLELIRTEEYLGRSIYSDCVIHACALAQILYGCGE